LEPLAIDRTIPNHILRYLSVTQRPPIELSSVGHHPKTRSSLNKTTKFKYGLMHIFPETRARVHPVARCASATERFSRPSGRRGENQKPSDAAGVLTDCS